VRNLSAWKKYQILKEFIKSMLKKACGIGLPEIIEIEPTNICNLRCIACHARFMKHDNVTNLDTSLLPRLTPLKGKWVVVGSTFEPSIHPRFVEIMKCLSDMECKIDVITNGTLLTKRVSDQLIDCNIKNVTISFDGIKKETYEKIRTGAKYESAMERILYYRESLKQNDVFFAINSLLMRSSIDELIETIDFWDSKYFHQVRFVFMVLRSLEKDLLKESLYPIREYAFKKLDEAAEYVINNNLKITLSSPYFNWSRLKRSHPNKVVAHLVKSGNPDFRDYFNPRQHFESGEYPGMKVNCRSPFTCARILWDGSVELCYKYTVGNLNERDFRDIWYGRKAQQVRLEVMTNPVICHACDCLRFRLGSDKIDVTKKINYFDQNLLNEVERVNFDEIVSYPEK